MFRRGEKNKDIDKTVHVYIYTSSHSYTFFGACEPILWIENHTHTI